MSDHQNSNKATILFDQQLTLDFAALVDELQRPFRNIALEFEETAVAEDSHVLFISPSLVVRIGYAALPDLAEYARPTRARHSGALVQTLLDDVRTALVVEVSDGPGRPMNHQTRLAACLHAVRHLAREYEASLVHWPHTNSLFTVEEFDSPKALEQPARPRHPVPDPKARHSHRPQMALAHGLAQELDATHRRLDASFAKAVAQRNAPPALKLRHRDDDLRQARGQIFGCDPSASDDDAPVGRLQKLSVYLMTLSLMLVYFPVGIATLIYTVFRGENINITARITALTGLGIGLSLSSMPLIGMV